MKHGSIRRTFALSRKEARQMLRDPGTLAMGILLPLFMLILFGYGLSLDIRDVPVGIVVERPSPEARELASGLDLSPWFRTCYVTNMRDAELMMLDRKIDAIVHLRGDFSRNAASGEPEAQVLVLGTDPNRARSIQVYANGALLMWAQRRIERGQDVQVGPVLVESRMWFNDKVDSHYFLIPGLITLIITIIGVMLTSMIVAREWERGTFEALFVTPARPHEILIAKAIPYFLLGMAGLALCIVSSRFLFHVPLRGSLILLTVGSMLFLLTSLSLGLFISALTRSQFESCMMSIVLSFLPATILSGYIFDLRSMPAALEVITRLLPPRYYVDFVKTVFLTGNVPGVFLRSLSFLAVLATLQMLLARAKMRKSLDR